MAKIYTKAGDNGTTSLAGGKKLKKHDAVIEAYGSIDELNASIGMAIAYFDEENEVTKILNSVQNQLFTIGGMLATEPLHWGKYWKDVNPEPYVEEIEKEIDEKSSQLEALKQFLLPGGSKTIAQLHVCRTICRRAERNICKIVEENNIFVRQLQYINRLSDLLFTLARYTHKIENIPEKYWKSKQ